jgi:hypothetical protein
VAPSHLVKCCKQIAGIWRLHLQGSSFLWKVLKCIRDYTASHPKNSNLPSHHRDNLISHINFQIWFRWILGVKSFKYVKFWRTVNLCLHRMDPKEVGTSHKKRCREVSPSSTSTSSSPVRDVQIPNYEHLGVRHNSRNKSVNDCVVFTSSHLEKERLIRKSCLFNQYKTCVAIILVQFSMYIINR